MMATLTKTGVTTAVNLGYILKGKFPFRIDGRPRPNALNLPPNKVRIVTPE